MEAAGLALAVLPLLLSQMDNYVQGIETFKLFGAKRYRRELEWYRSNLGTQKAIFENTLMRLLDGVHEYEDGIDDLAKNPLGDLLQRESLWLDLREKLAGSFEPFCQTMNEFLILLKDLYRKLGWESRRSAVNLQSDKSVLKNELKKFKDIFSKSVYEGMFIRIDTANNLLKTLAEQSDHRRNSLKKRHSKRPLMRQRKVRKSARSLYDAIIQGECWNCVCRDQHAINFILKHPDLEQFQDPGKYSADSRFRMIFASRNTSRKCPWGLHGLEVETKTETIQPPPYAQKAYPPYCKTGQIPNWTQKKVQFHHEEEDFSQRYYIHQSNEMPIISDMCSTLSVVEIRSQVKKPFGCFSDDTHRHNMHYIRKLAADLRVKSLSDLIIDSSDYFKAPTSDRFLLTQKQRLRLAVNLACSVLQFHGSWLQSHWRAKDIMFNTSIDIENPFVQWNVGNEAETRSMCQDHSTMSSPLIQSEILFPLGLVLVELSLCQTLERLRTAEDEDRTEACAYLKTAARFLNLVEQQSGTEYKKVVKTCLFWPGNDEFDLDNEEMQDDMFRLVISPLLDNLRIFEGGK